MKVEEICKVNQELTNKIKGMLKEDNGETFQLVSELAGLKKMEDSFMKIDVPKNLTSLRDTSIAGLYQVLAPFAIKAEKKISQMKQEKPKPLDVIQ